jgi:hypothetical protein
MSDQDDLPDDDAAANQALEAYQRDRDGLHDAIVDYLEDCEVDTAAAVHMLLEIAVGMRVDNYGFGVENPSVAGLRLDLDRLARVFAELVRDTKKDAEAQIDDIKQAIAKAKAEGEPEGERGEVNGEDEGD